MPAFFPTCSVLNQQFVRRRDSIRFEQAPKMMLDRPKNCPSKHECCRDRRFWDASDVAKVHDSHATSVVVRRHPVAVGEPLRYEPIVFEVTGFGAVEDYYLSTGEESFSLRDLHLVGGDEREPVNSPGLAQAATLEYVPICLEKIRTTIASETETTLQQPSGFSWLPFTRGELHLYNLRHVQHHTGQLSAQLRRLDPNCASREMLRWVRTGWR